MHKHGKVYLFHARIYPPFPVESEITERQVTSVCVLFKFYTLKCLQKDFCFERFHTLDFITSNFLEILTQEKCFMSYQENGSPFS